jgi:oxygen-independent coproporphyrinogen-3 oxidase
MLAGGVRYHAELVPNDDAIARMYSEAIDSLATAGLAQYEISNFCQPGFASRHNLRYWQRRPYLGLGLDASSMLRAPRSGPGDLPNVLRATTADDLTAYLEASQPLETAWHSPASQLEEAWFLGLRLNAGVSVADLESEFGRAAVAPALEVVSRLAEEGLLVSEGGVVRLTACGQLLSNDVFQEFLGLATAPELISQQMRL